jgi:hypothetical protein
MYVCTSMFFKIDKYKYDFMEIKLNNSIVSRTN